MCIPMPMLTPLPTRMPSSVPALFFVSMPYAYVVEASTNLIVMDLAYKISPIE